MNIFNKWHTNYIMASQLNKKKSEKTKERLSCVSCEVDNIIKEATKIVKDFKEH